MTASESATPTGYDALRSQLRHRAVQTMGIELFAVEAGPQDGPLVILLHGFPEYWYGWRHQICPLADAGYRVLVPDQRGYHISDKPRKIRDYRVDVLARDIVGLIDDADRDTAHIVGHDWGGAVAWWLALAHPDRVERLAILNAPHPVVMRRALISSSAQRRRSWYFLWFQPPGHPERRLSADRFARLRRLLAASSREGTFSDEDFERYVEAWDGPGAMTGMINWYRALRYRPKLPHGPRVVPPTLVAWGTRDRFLGAELGQSSIELCDDGRLEPVESASHWIQHEEPELVNELLLDHFGGTVR